MFAVEVENAYVRSGTLKKLLGEIDGVAHLDGRRGTADERVTFTYRDIDFMVLEPFGDSNRYWIGPVDPTTLRMDITPIERRLSAFEPSRLAKFVGNLLMLRLGSLFGR
jgi:hypothetical protein